MKRSLSVFFLLALTMCVMPEGIGAARHKIAVVNMDKIFNQYYKTKIENARIKKQADVYREYLVSLNKSREKLQEEFVKFRDSAQNIAYSDAERENSRISAQNKYRQLQAKDTEIQQYNAEKREQLMQEYQKIKVKLVGEIMNVVESIGTRDKYTLILDTTGSSTNGIPTVVYHDKYLDITKEVTKHLNLGRGKSKK